MNGPGQGKTIAEAVADISQRIAKAQKTSQLAAGSVTLLAASKAQGTESIAQAIAAGVTHFGENRVQEAETKWVELKRQYPETTLHCIGPLQTNKVREAVAIFDVIQTVDREKLVDALVAEMAKAGKALACYVQVNTGEEEQKAGVAPADAPRLIAYARRAGLEVAGLMCVPPVGQHPAPHFALLKQIADAEGILGLSMGMSEDFETAIRMGATCVRLGRTIFGERTN